MISFSVFWASVLILVYVYYGYPLLVRCLARFIGTKPQKKSVFPSVTVIVAAYNEQIGIRSKLDSIVQLNYPADLLDVIVASDASTDKTDEIVLQYPSDRVQLLRVEGRLGKTACQNAAVEVARGEVVLFTDATTRLAADAVTRMVENFSDPSVACVAGTLVYEARQSSITGQGGAAYWQYEVGLRAAESSLGSLVGVSGCLYAVRRSAYSPIPADLISDFVIAMRIREKGGRTVLESGAVCYEDTLETSRSELSMRVRVAVRSINALIRERRVLNPFRSGLFAWQLWSHKVLRYASPVFWLCALASNIALMPAGTLYQLAFAAQLAILLLGFVGFLQARQHRPTGLLRAPYYFLLTNLASLIAILRYLRGDRMVTWNPVR